MVPFMSGRGASAQKGTGIRLPPPVKRLKLNESRAVGQFVAAFKRNVGAGS